jgi:ornithine--oxo-acid transaminase
VEAGPRRAAFGKRCLGAELFSADGRRILDFLSGYRVHNAGHNYSEIVAASARA